MQHVLDDILVSGLHVAFVGTAAGTVSAVRGAYYAGPGNKFWKTLAAINLTPRLLRPEEFRRLPDWGIGLTDIAKRTSGSDASLQDSDLDVNDFLARIRAVRPRLIAFNGLKAARVFYGNRNGRIAYGAGPSVPDFPAAYVLPSTSGAASGYWSITPWQELAAQISGTVAQVRQ